ncbi:hypothetical protein KUTeg_016394 [Tegillarca granosa]|uniref:Uncharacterized protein n=1 Tax=Tegillarca granosa TaxID=220873 RepID=A0ABQ9ELQ4_TEGGR|nr:hypothetical protein KUTeg_016394 [Tegillarca granosa]
MSALFRVGRVIGLHPVKTLVICVLLTGLCGIGMLKFAETNDNQTIWVPADSDVIRNKNWVEDKFPPSTRFVNIIFEAENILTPTSLKAMFDIYKNTTTLQTANGKNITSLCQV